MVLITMGLNRQNMLLNLLNVFKGCFACMSSSWRVLLCRCRRNQDGSSLARNNPERDWTTTTGVTSGGNNGNESPRRSITQSPYPPLLPSAVECGVSL